MFSISGNPGDAVPCTDGVPRQPDVAQIPILLGILCSEHMGLSLPGMSWLEMLQPRPTNLNSHGCYISNFRIPESWQKLRISSAKIWLKAVCIYQELCASIPSLSRGAMSFSLILALWKEQMVPRSRTSEPELQFGAAASFSLAPEFHRPLLAFIYLCKWGESASSMNWCVKHE